MDKLLIEGPSKLNGSVRISRSKNAYLPIMAATLLTSEPIYLKDLPKLRDIKTMTRLLENLGVKIERLDGEVTKFDASKLKTFEATYDLVKTMRASVLVLGPLLSRFREAMVSLPGGCAIGTRPIDFHIEGLMKMGADIYLDGGYVKAQTDGLTGETINLRFPSVGATENIMMAAVLASGTTIIRNAAIEPEISDLAHFLNGLGAKIEGMGTAELVIEGVTKLNGGEYRAISDRIEAATYVIAALITNSEITLYDTDSENLKSVLSVLKDMGARIESSQDVIKIYKSDLKNINKIDTSPYPGLPTDVQAQLMALSVTLNGPSIITENIFENRFMHVPELKRMGAKIILKGKSAFIEGNNRLLAAPVMCTDLRASAALVIAALAAYGTTEIRRVYHLDRGYETLEEKLTNLGVNIKRVNKGPGDSL